MKIHSFEGIKCILPEPIAEGKTWTKFLVGSYSVKFEQIWTDKFVFKCKYLEFDLKNKPKEKSAEYYYYGKDTTLWQYDSNSRISVLEEFLKELGFTLNENKRLGLTFNENRRIF